VNKIINWVADHDNKKVFIVLYISISLVLSIAISLFWLLFAVLIHFLFEVVGQSHKRVNGKSVLLESLWETKLDFALVMFAWWLAIYLDFIFGVAGIGAAARVGAQTASRAGQVGGKAVEASARVAAWSRIIRAVLLSLDDIGNAVKAIYQSRTKKNQAIESTPVKPKEKLNLPNKTDALVNHTSSWFSKWNIVDYIGVVLFCLCFLLIVLAPVLIGVSLSEIIGITLNEFHPWP
jgi:hypothetical protein